MFCPKCGNKCADGTEFCGKCGARIGDRQAKPALQNSKPAVKRPLPLIPIAVVAVLLVAGIAFALNLGKPAQKTPVQGVDQGGESTAAVEGTANRIDPAEKIKVSNLKIEEDAVKRYVVTGTLQNVSSETYNVTLSFKVSRHSSDSYGEETVKEVPLLLSQTTTNFTSISNENLLVYDLAPTVPGKEFTFTVYPKFESVEEFLSDPVCTVERVVLPETEERTLFDHSDGIKTGKSEVTADGVAKIEYVNETGLYLKEASIRLICYNKQDIPAVFNNQYARPYGAVVTEAKVETVKPGDTGTFQVDVGEGFSRVETMDKSYTPDLEKNSVN